MNEMKSVYKLCSTSKIMACDLISEFVYSVILIEHLLEEDIILATGDSMVSKPHHSSCPQELWRQILNNYTHKYLVAHVVL